MKQIRKTITKAEIAAMPKVLFPGRIFVIYTESEAEKAVAYLKDQRIVGVDTETRPSFKRGTTHKVALLQISTQDTCFLFRLNRIGMPDSLQEFFDERYLEDRFVSERRFLTRCGSVRMCIPTGETG